MPAGMKEEEEVEGDVVAETEVSEDEVVLLKKRLQKSEETQEVVAEEEATEEEEVVEEEQIDIEADVKALFEGEELSEEFQNKARTIFEAAINSKLAEVKESVKSPEYEEQLVEEVASIKSELEERVDAYLEYVADEWMTDNQIAVESGLKTEMTDSFLTGMKRAYLKNIMYLYLKTNMMSSRAWQINLMKWKVNSTSKSKRILL